MNGLSILVWVLVCASGGLLFLKYVSEEIEFTEIDLENFEAQQRREYKKRLEAQDIPTVSSVSA